MRGVTDWAVVLLLMGSLLFLGPAEGRFTADTKGERFP